jgi:MinD-like ATPase involved in chromosome partitioning or flagellar assembly
MAVEIAIGVSHRPWAQDLFRHVADHGGAVVRKRVLTDEDALEEDYAVLVVDDTANVLTPRMIQELHRRGRRILAVHAAGDHHAAEVLGRLGIDATIEDVAAPESFVEAVNAVAPQQEPASVDAAFAEIARGLGEDLPHAGTLAAPEGPWRGWVTAVAAVSGGLGATEVALGLVAAMRQRDERAVVVDADELAPALAQRVCASLIPNLRNAIDAVEQHVGKLEDMLTPLPARFDVLCGLSNPADWPDVRPDQVAGVLAELAQVRPQVLVNVASRIEDLTSANGLARHGVTRAVLTVADQVVLVAAPTPVGIARLLDWVRASRELVHEKPVHVAINRGPMSGFRRGELEREIFRAYIPSSLAVLPDDRRVEDAVWNGRPVLAGPFLKAVRQLATALPQTPPPKGRRRAERRSAHR